MAQPACDADTFEEMFRELGAAGTARALGIDVRAVFRRRAHIERTTGQTIKTADPRSQLRPTQTNPARIPLEIDSGVVLVGSDPHYWPGETTTAHRAFVGACKSFGKELRAVILNGDILDGATISRHPPLGWETRPSLIQEIETCQERLHEIVEASGKAARIWPVGNHDARFETRLASVAPEYAKIHGVHLQDHFPLWEPCYSCWINDDVVVKHRFRSGVHAGWNNTVNAGKTTVTGHTHKLNVSPMSDYNGTRWGVECGMFADVGAAQFEYAEDNPSQHRSGFIVLTFHKGTLLWPEIARVIEPGMVDFRGKVYSV